MSERTCEHCDGPNLTPRSRWCSVLCKDRAKVLRRGVDCSACGKRIPEGRGVRRDGTAKCRPCRQADPSRVTWVPEWRTCWCGTEFKQTSATQKYCMTSHSPSWSRNKTPRERAGRSGHRWRKLREQVLAEETHCWLCHEWVDQSALYGQPGAPEVDHVVAIRDGGDPWDRANLRLTHRACNRRRKRVKSPVR